MNRVHIGRWVARVAYICLYRNRFWKMDTMHGMHMYAQRPFEKIGRQAWEAQVCKETASGTSGMVYASVHRNRFKRLDIAHGMHMYAQKLFQKHQAWYTQVCSHCFRNLDVRRRTDLLPWHGCQRRRRAPEDCGSLPPARGVCSTCLRSPGSQLGSHTAPPQSGQPQ